MEYVTRTEWKARKPKRRPHHIGATKTIFDHHAAGYISGEAAAVRDIQRNHQQDRGWNDIAYNWLYSDTGTIYEGRGWNVAGGATKGWNTWSISVCYIGNAQTRKPTADAFTACETIHREAERLMGTQTIRPHQAVSQTLCPGQYIIHWLNNGRPIEEQEMAVTWQDEPAFDMAIVTAYETTGPNLRTPTMDERQYWLARFQSGDDPTWLIAACKNGLKSEDAK